MNLLQQWQQVQLQLLLLLVSLGFAMSTTWGAQGATGDTIHQWKYRGALRGTQQHEAGAEAEGAASEGAASGQSQPAAQGENHSHNSAYSEALEPESLTSASLQHR